jgi:uncharacterized membrane protein
MSDVLVLADLGIPPLPFEVNLFTRWLHILPAAFAAGTSLFLFLVLQPAAGELPDDAHDKLRAGIRARLAKWVHISVALLLITGLINFAFVSLGQIRAYKDATGQGSLYHPLFGIKFLLALFVFFSQSLLVGRSSLAQKWQANARRWVGVNALLLVLIIVLSGAMGLLRAKAVRDTLSAPAATGWMNAE